MLSWPTNWPQCHQPLFVFTLATVFLSALIFAAPSFSSFSPMPLPHLEICTIEKMSSSLKVHLRYQQGSDTEQVLETVNVATSRPSRSVCNSGYLSWLCGWLLSVIPPNIDTKQGPGSSLTIGTRCLKYCQSWVLIRASDVSYTRHDGLRVRTLPTSIIWILTP